MRIVSDLPEEPLLRKNASDVWLMAMTAMRRQLHAKTFKYIDVMYNLTLKISANSLFTFFIAIAALEEKLGERCSSPGHFSSVHRLLSVINLFSFYTSSPSLRY
jgi:hypothetical protein